MLIVHRKQKVFKYKHIIFLQKTIDIKLAVEYKKINKQLHKTNTQKIMIKEANNIVILFPECGANYLIGQIMGCFEKRKFRLSNSKQGYFQDQKLLNILREKKKIDPSFEVILNEEAIQSLKKGPFYLLELDERYADSDADIIAEEVQKKFELYQAKVKKYPPLIELVKPGKKALYDAWKEFFK